MTLEEMKQRFIDGSLERGIFTSRSDNNEELIVEVGDDGFKITTSQSNGWLRINIYTYNGNYWTYEELYER